MADFGLVAGAVSRAMSETLGGAAEGELQAVDIRRLMGEMARKRREAEMRESLFPGALQEQRLGIEGQRLGIAGERLGIEEKQLGIAGQRQVLADREYAQAEYRKLTADGTKEPTLPELLGFFSNPRVIRAGYETPAALSVWQKFAAAKAPDVNEKRQALMSQRLNLTNRFDRLKQQFSNPILPKIKPDAEALAEMKQIIAQLGKIDQELQKMGGVAPPSKLPTRKPEKESWSDYFKRIISEAVSGAPEARGTAPFDFLPAGPAVERAVTPPKAPAKPKPLAAAKKPPASPTPQAAIAEAERLMARGHTPESAIKAMQGAGWDVD